MQNKAILRKRLKSSGVDGILITDLKNIFYLTGFTGSSGLLIVTKKHSVFITDFRYQEQAEKEIKGFDIEIEKAERTLTIKKLAEKYGIKKLGFEDHNMTFQMYKKLLGRKIRLKPLTGTVEDLRIIKNPDELLHIKKAVRRAESAFRKLQPFIKSGTTERKLAIKLEGLLKEEGCKIVPFGVIVASGRTSALPHAKPTNRMLKKGDLILFDWGGESGGYYSDMTRMVAIKGCFSEKHLEMFSVVIDAQKKALASVKPGVKASFIDYAARDFIKQKGYDDNFGHSTGHGIGLDVHEKPFISWNNKNRIRDGMVFTLEPGIYMPELGGVRIEDMVIAKKTGTEVLTSLPKKLKIIEG